MIRYQIPKLSENHVKRFWERVDKNGPIPSHVPHIGRCWKWTGSIHKAHKYAIMHIGKRGFKAYRISYKLNREDFDIALNMCHHCDNPSCVNPAHLFPGTQIENILDCMKKGRKKGALGERNRFAQLNKEQVVKIRQLVSEKQNNGMTFAQIGGLFGVGETAVSHIHHNRTWRHVVS